MLSKRMRGKKARLMVDNYRVKVDMFQNGDRWGKKEGKKDKVLKSTKKSTKKKIQVLNRKMSNWRESNRNSEERLREIRTLSVEIFNI